VRHSLQEVRAPILLVLGKLDFAIPHTTWLPLIEGLDNIRSVVLSEDSHNPQTEAPERFDPVLIDWLQAVAAAV
jgi:proline iminopeptidase